MDSSMWRLLPCTLHAYPSFRHWLKALERYWKAVHTIHKLFLIIRRTWGARGPVQGATRWAPNPLPWRVRNGWKLSGSYISYISYRIDRKHPKFKPIDMNSGNQTDSVPLATATLQHVGKFMEVPTMVCQCLFKCLFEVRDMASHLASVAPKTAFRFLSFFLFFMVIQTFILLVPCAVTFDGQICAFERRNDPARDVKGSRSQQEWPWVLIAGCRTRVQAQPICNPQSCSLLRRSKVVQPFPESHLYPLESQGWGRTYQLQLVCFFFPPYIYIYVDHCAFCILLHLVAPGYTLLHLVAPCCTWSPLIQPWIRATGHAQSGEKVLCRWDYRGTVVIHWKICTENSVA